MKGASQRLSYGVPAPFPFEAPTSWLTRLACAQGLSAMTELLRFLGLPPGVDLDWHLRDAAVADLRWRCNLPPQSFAIASRVMAGAAVSGISAARLLLAGKDGAAQFRFCPCCLAERKVAHLDIHWRFRCWRWCPPHNCMLVTACQACSAPVEHPSLIETTPAGRVGLASLSRCTRCCSRFNSDQIQQLAAGGMQALGRAEKAWVSSGRTVLAALYHQRFHLREQWHPVQHLGSEYPRLVGPTQRIDRKLEAWRLTREFLADLSDDVEEEVEPLRLDRWAVAPRSGR
ncbi:TniQ family protein [Roseateles sp.]|uniref:TniQ family protein n=1 Tax=Roseateles sp. TaxID=1971397 RepID=UPI0039E88C80